VFELERKDEFLVGKKGGSEGEGIFFWLVGDAYVYGIGLYMRGLYRG